MHNNHIFCFNKGVGKGRAEALPNLSSCYYVYKQLPQKYVQI